LTTGSGRATLAGVAVCLSGIAVCGLAGLAKEKTLPEAERKKSIKEFNLARGLWVAIVAGALSACLNFGIKAGGAIAELAAGAGGGAIWKGTPILIVVMAGGFTTNFVWCVWLNWKNGSASDYFKVRELSLPVLAGNYFFSAIAGTLWYMQFMFYTMGDTQIGEYGFASWSLLMAFVIIFSNFWGVALHEWRGAGRRAAILIASGLAVLLLSTVIIGWGAYLKELK
jgi:L-rhamnose-H+ transport protein